MLFRCEIRRRWLLDRESHGEMTRGWSGWMCTIRVAIRTFYNSDHLSLSMPSQTKQKPLLLSARYVSIYRQEKKARAVRESKHVQTDYLITYAYIIQVDLTFIKQLFVELYHGACLDFVRLKFLQKRRD